jgi:hypoxanthine phosphoribosyltransferase
MEQTVEKVFLSWGDIQAAVEILASRITNSDIKIEAIGGLPRGGLIPAVMLSHKMSIPFVSQVNIAKVPGNILIVDDICDSGETLKQFKFEENVYTATIHHKRSAVVEPNFFYQLAYENQWIVYPWENKDSDTVADYLKNK